MLTSDSKNAVVVISGRDEKIPKAFFGDVE